MKQLAFTNPWQRIVFNLAVAVFTLLVTLAFYKLILLASVLLLLLALFALYVWRSSVTIYIFLFAAFLGSLSEITATSQGVWTYTVSNFFTIPLWLPFVWGIAAAFIYQMAVAFKQLGVQDT